jgi:serine/threonine/tyrosine-interacting protein
MNLQFFAIIDSFRFKKPHTTLDKFVNTYILVENMEDWKYSQRWEMQKVYDQIYLGPYSVAKNQELLQSNNITHILCIRDVEETQFIKPFHPSLFQYSVVDCKNSQMESIIQKFATVSKWIDEVVKKGGNVLVHCVGGISRAPCFVIAYLMEYHNMSFDVAYQTVQSKRFCINPIESFFGQLKVFFG